MIFASVLDDLSLSFEMAKNFPDQWVSERVEAFDDDVSEEKKTAPYPMRDAGAVQVRFANI